MAGEFSPVLDEASVRQYPAGGYDGAQPYNYLGRQINNVGNSVSAAYESTLNTDADLAPLAKRAKDLVSRASQVNDLTGKPIQSRQKTVHERANLIADAGVIAGPEGVRFVSSILDNALGGELGVTSSNASLQAREDYLQKRDEAGILALGPGASDEDIAREGDRQLRIAAEIEISSSRIALAKQQLELNDGNYNYNKRIIQDEASNIASKFVAENLQPFFRQIAETNLSDPESISNNRKMLVDKQAEIAAALSANFNQLGVDFATQSEIMSQVNQRFKFMDDGMAVMAGLPAAQLKQLQGVNQLLEIEQATYLGQLFSIFGPEQVGAIFDSAAIQDPNISAELGKNLISFFARGDQARAALRLQDLSNPETTMELATKIVTNPISGTNATDLSSLADASKALTAGALESDYNSQVNTVDMLSNPQYLTNLQKTNDPAAIGQVALFHSEMATRLAIMIGQVADQVDGIEITHNSDGTITPDWEGWGSAISRVWDAYTDAPLSDILTTGQPWVRAAAGITQGLRGIEASSTFSQLQKMVQTHTKAVNSLNTLGATLPRGLRNNNPGNVERTSQTWVGEVVGSDPRFETFNGIDKGVRAIGKIMKSNSELSVRDFINRYAPPTENDTAAYQASVAGAGINLDSKVSEVNALDLTKAIITKEIGYQPLHDDFISEALNNG